MTELELLEELVVLVLEEVAVDSLTTLPKRARAYGVLASNTGEPDARFEREDGEGIGVAGEEGGAGGGERVDEAKTSAGGREEDLETSGCVCVYTCDCRYAYAKVCKSKNLHACICI